MKITLKRERGKWWSGGIPLLCDMFEEYCDIPEDVKEVVVKIRT